MKEAGGRVIETRQPNDPAHDPVCAYCGRLLPAMEALIYHGVAYHPACVEPTTRRRPTAPRPPARRPPAAPA